MRHGKWWDRWRDVPLEQVMEGRFDRLFGPAELPPADFSSDDLTELAGKMTADVESPPTPETEVDSEENSGIVAIYTYLGQFIDHDITFDPTSHLREFASDLDELVDFRTPRLDLDNVYAAGRATSHISMTQATGTACSSASRCRETNVIPVRSIFRAVRVGAR